jgi:hypothetical protein
VLFSHDVDSGIADEGIVDAKAARQPGPDLRGCAPGAELAAGFSDTGVVDCRRDAG